jgi:enoyl-[acyl-carrier protein] reductase II
MMFEDNRVVRDTGAVYPIFQAPMTWIARGQLVGAVSAAGGLGLLEGASADLEMTVREIAAIRAQTDRPFGVNLPIKFLRRNAEVEDKIIDVIASLGVRFVTTSAGDPTRYSARLKAAGLTVYHAVPSVQGALKAVDAGVDGLIVEGGESGGIRGLEPVHSFVLLQAVRERVSLPIVAAGGVVDGRGMAAAFALGAEGVAMGTRFVASTESPVHDGYKRGILEAPSNGTIPLSFELGVNSRVLKTDLARQVAAGEVVKTRSAIATVYKEGDLTLGLGSAGESAGLIHEIKPVARIIEDTVEGFRREVGRLASLL